MDAPTKPLPVVRLTLLGDADAAACEGDFCEVPEHHTQAAVNRRIDEGAI